MIFALFISIVYYLVRKFFHIFNENEDDNLQALTINEINNYLLSRNTHPTLNNEQNNKNISIGSEHLNNNVQPSTGSSNDIC